MIDREHELSISAQANLLGISRGTVYYLPRPISPEDLALMRKLDELHLEHPFMGGRVCCVASWLGKAFTPAAGISGR